MHIKIDKNIFFDKIVVKNSVALLDLLLQVYSVANFDEKNKLVPSQRKVLVYYIKNGLTEQTLSDIKEDYPKYNSNYLHQVNKQLRDKGYLIKDTHNEHRFFLNKDLEHFRTMFITNNCLTYMIGVAKES
jgi:hypothetical protein